jgi:hypothetical protein
MFMDMLLSTALRLRSRRSSWLLIAAMLVTGAPDKVGAQATVPGSSGIEPTRIRFGTMEYSLTIVRGDEEESIGVLRDEIMPIRSNDPVLRRVMVLSRSGEVLIDSTHSDLETLAPLWHRSVQPKRNIDFEMSGRKVKGSVAAAGTPVKMIDTTLADLSFDSSNWDLVVRALPLESGDAAVLSVYDVDKNLQRYTMRVVDRTVKGKTDVIHVTVETGRGNEIHAWFDDKTRVLLRVETRLGPDTLLRQVLKPM